MAILFARNALSLSSIKLNILPLIAVLMIIMWTCSYAGTEDRYKYWLGFDVESNFKPGSKWHYDIFAQPRFAANEVMLEQFVFRPSIYYQYSKNWSYWLGYDAIPVIPRTRTKVFLEQRIWPQVRYSKRIAKRIKLTLRTRYEFRRLSSSKETATRFRQRFETTFIGKHANSLSYDFFYEGFIRGKEADWVAKERVDQNRIYAGAEIPVNIHTVLNIGYLGIFRPRKPNNRLDNILSVGVSFNLEENKPGPITTV